MSQMALNINIYVYTEIYFLNHKGDLLYVTRSSIT